MSDLLARYRHKPVADWPAHVCDGKTRREIERTASEVEFWTLCDVCNQWWLSGMYVYDVIDVPGLTWNEGTCKCESE